MTQVRKIERKPRSKAEQRAETLGLILDAAEELFSNRGLDGVTLRDIAQRVGVHTSLMHYYFADKLSLFEAVFARKAKITVERRLKALDLYEAEANGRPTVEGALRAFLDTDFDLYISGGPSWTNYAAFVAQVSNTPEIGARLMDEHFDPVVLRLIEILTKALPHGSKVDLFWGYDFITGALMHCLAHTGRIDKLSGGLCRSTDMEAVKQRMASFMAAGLTALCSRDAER